MRIGIVTTWFERGAAYVSRQYRQALEPAHEVFVYARGGEAPPRSDPAWDDPAVTWGAQGIVPVVNSIDLDDFRRWLRDRRLDAVLFNEQRWLEPVLVCDELGITSAAYIDYYTEETVPFFGCYDVLISNTRRHHGVFEWHPQSAYVPWGTDTELFRPAAAAADPPETLTFFHSAGMNPRRKGTDQVVRAFARTAGPARLLVHAQVELGTSVPEVAALVESLAASGRLELITRTVAAPGLYHLGDVYVYPARLDGLGLTVPEALACGLPAIVPDNAPMNEFVNSDCGRLTPVSRFFSRSDGYYWPQCLVDENALAEQMQWYADDRRRLPQMKAAARRQACAHLDWRTNSRELPALFETFRRLPRECKADAIDAARRWEREHVYGSFRGWLGWRYPGAVRALRAVRKAEGKPRSD